MGFRARVHALVGRTRITPKLLVTVSGVVLLAIALQAWLYFRSVVEENASAEDRHLRLLARSFQDDVHALELESGALATAFADRPQIAELASSGDRAGLLRQFEAVFQTLQEDFGVVHLDVHRPDGYVLLRVHDPDRFGDHVGEYRHSVEDAVRERRAVTGVELDPSRLGVRGVAPVMSNEKVVALVEVGLNYDQAFLEGLRARNGADYRIWLSYDAAAPSGLWPRGALPPSPSSRLFHYAATDVSLPHPPEQDYLVALEGADPIIRSAGTGRQEEVAVLLMPLRGYGNSVLGVLEITASRTEALARLRRTRALSAALAGALALVALLVMGFATRAIVLRSLRHLTEVAKRWSLGDRTARATIHTEDELGVLGRTFNLLTDRISELLREMEREVAASRSAEQAAQHELLERQRLEEELRQAQKMEAIGRLAGGVAHDFNNLLTVITGNLELARMDLPAGSPVQPYLEDLHEAAESATALTRQLLAFSRRQLVEPQVISLNALVSRVKKMLQRLLGEDVKLETQLAPDLGMVLADPGQFEQVLVNLAVNARDAMPGGGTLTIRTEEICFAEGERALLAHLHPGPHVVLAVQDSGVGMSEEVRRRIFEPFFTTKPKGRGTGFGLATVFGAVTQAGGVIQAESELGRGTTFRVILPRVDAPAAALPRSERLPEDAGGTETVLLVEDEAKVRGLVLDMLRRLGYRVVNASSGAAALALVEGSREPIDLLLTDVVMPGMNGRELADRLALVRSSVKVLYMSGYADEVITKSGVLDGDVSFIAKPFTMRDLARKLREVLAERATSFTP